MHFNGVLGGLAYIAVGKVAADVQLVPPLLSPCPLMPGGAQCHLQVPGGAEVPPKVPGGVHQVTASCPLENPIIPGGFAISARSKWCQLV